MCPLRVILIFLSATIAGFFLIRGLNAEPDQFDADADADESGSPRAPLPLHSKRYRELPPWDPGFEPATMSCRSMAVSLGDFENVGSAVKTGFWTMVDMASGRYLWRTLVAQPVKSESDKAR